ncbi:hypothetical protein JAAARDRAFT_580405 [Jaapia argillacea MUCL 33604]|uniref:Uncharacterized protein n=1 Tax=Jaapia argillacea MUCL 33604 TaxID=933084 RepID=A0A067P6R0_9AGAM|nr:hypothetical protein JAAARDRAFT_580405 [Jaapia argillacea MUCL 33604]
MVSKDSTARKRARADRAPTVAPPTMGREELRVRMAELMEQMKMAEEAEGTAGEVKDTEANEMKGNEDVEDVTAVNSDEETSEPLAKRVKARTEDPVVPKTPSRTKSKLRTKTPAPTRAKSEAPKAKTGKEKAENAKGEKGKEKAENAKGEKDKDKAENAKGEKDKDKAEDGGAERENIRVDSKKPEPASASVGGSASASTSEAAKPIRIGQLSIAPDDIPYIVNLLLGLTPKSSVRPFGTASQRDLFIQAGLLKQAILQTFYQKHTATMAYYKLMGNQLREKEFMAQCIHVDQNMTEEEIILQWVEGLVPAPKLEADGE